MSTSRPLGRFDLIHAAALDALAKVLAKGAARHGDWAWLEYPPAFHINRGIRHAYLHLTGDRSEPHLSHAFARFMMATALTDVRVAVEVKGMPEPKEPDLSYITLHGLSIPGTPKALLRALEEKYDGTLYPDLFRVIALCRVQEKLLAQRADKSAKDYPAVEALLKEVEAKYPRETYPDVHQVTALCRSRGDDNALLEEETRHLRDELEEREERIDGLQDSLGQAIDEKLESEKLYLSIKRELDDLHDAISRCSSGVDPDMAPQVMGEDS